MTRSPTGRGRALEAELRNAGRLIAGVDEVGRGPLAGPVVACAVVMPVCDPLIAGVTDSKALTRSQRGRLAPLIVEQAVSVGLGAASVREIERLNILRATVLAMRRALARLRVNPDVVLVDGRPVRELQREHIAIVGGDLECYSIACASIVAKVTRDRLMDLLAERYPRYGWDTNAGYGSAEHLAAISVHGPTAHHRMTFRPLRTEPS